MGILEDVAELQSQYANLKAVLKAKNETIESLKTEKYTLYGDGCGFLAKDSAGGAVWVNSTSVALEQKDKEIAQLQTDLADSKVAIAALELANDDCRNDLAKAKEENDELRKAFADYPDFMERLTKRSKKFQAEVERLETRIQLALDCGFSENCVLCVARHKALSKEGGK